MGVVEIGGGMSFRFVEYPISIQFSMTSKERDKLVQIARIDRKEMQLLSASIEIQGKGVIQLIKRYKCRYYPHKREMRYLTRIGDDDNNKEVFNEIALIDEQL